MQQYTHPQQTAKVIDIRLTWRTHVPPRPKDSPASVADRLRAMELITKGP